MAVATGKVRGLPCDEKPAVAIVDVGVAKRLVETRRIRRASTPHTRPISCNSHAHAEIIPQSRRLRPYRLNERAPRPISERRRATPRPISVRRTSVRHLHPDHKEPVERVGRRVPFFARLQPRPAVDGVAPPPPRSASATIRQPARRRPSLRNTPFATILPYEPQECNQFVYPRYCIIKMPTGSFRQ